MSFYPILLFPLCSYWIHQFLSLFSHNCLLYQCLFCGLKTYSNLSHFEFKGFFLGSMQLSSYSQTLTSVCPSSLPPCPTFTFLFISIRFFFCLPRTPIHTKSILKWFSHMVFITRCLGNALKYLSLCFSKLFMYKGNTGCPSEPHQVVKHDDVPRRMLTSSLVSSFPPQPVPTPLNLCFLSQLMAALSFQHPKPETLKSL